MRMHYCTDCAHRLNWPTTEDKLIDRCGQCGFTKVCNVNFLAVRGEPMVNRNAEIGDLPEPPRDPDARVLPVVICSGGMRIMRVTDTVWAHARGVRLLDPCDHGPDVRVIEVHIPQSQHGYEANRQDLEQI